MADSSTVRSRIEHYGGQIMRLVAEAYREGIVITVPPPDGGVELLPPSEGQAMYGRSTAIPSLGYSHWNLKAPPMIYGYAIVQGTAKEPGEIVPSFQLPLPPQHK